MDNSEDNRCDIEIKSELKSEGSCDSEPNGNEKASQSQNMDIDSIKEEDELFLHCETDQATIYASTEVKCARDNDSIPP